MDFNTRENVLLVSRVSDILLEFAEENKEQLTTSDYQGMAMVKAMRIIEIIKKG